MLTVRLAGAEFKKGRWGGWVMAAPGWGAAHQTPL